MPMIIREYTSTAAKQGLQLSNAPAEAAAATGRAWQGAADQIGQVADQVYTKYKQGQDAADLTAGNAALNAYELQGHQASSAAVQNMDPNDPHALDDFTSKSLEPGQQALNDKFADYSPQVREQLSRSLSDATTRIQTGFVTKQSEVQGEQAKANYLSSQNSLGQIALDSPEQLQSVMQTSDTQIAALQGHGFNGPQTQAMKLDARDSLAAKAMDGQFNKMLSITDPAQQLNAVSAMDAMLHDPSAGYKGNLTPDHFAAAEEKIAKMKATTVDIGSALAKQAFPDLLSQIKTGGASQETINQAMQTARSYTGKTTEETVLGRNSMAHDLTEAMAFGQQSQQVRELPDSDIGQLRQQTQSAYEAATTQDARVTLKAKLDAIDSAQKSRDTEFHSDPALYSINHNDMVNARLGAFTQAPTPQNFAAYAQATEAYQRQLFPGEVPKYATQHMRDTIGATMQSLQNDPGSLANAGQTLATWADTTGDKWVQVAHELYQGKSPVLNQDQFVAATLYAKPEARVIANTLLQASSMNKDQRFKLHGISEEAAVKAAIPVLQDLAQSFGNTGPQGADLVASNVTSLAHLMQVRGSVDDAEKLAGTLVNDEFNFVGRGGYNTLRIPNRPELHADDIKSGTDSVLRDVGKLDLVVPKSLSGLGPNDQRANYVDRLQHDGVWYANKDGTGAELRDISGGSPVMENRGGKQVPVERKWADLQNIPGTASDKMSRQNIETYERMGSH